MVGQAPPELWRVTANRMGVTPTRFIATCLGSDGASPYPSLALPEPRLTGIMKTRRSPARFHSVIIQAGALGSFSLDPNLLRATGVCLHVDLFASVRIDDLERGRRMIQSHRLDLSIRR